MFQFMYLLLYKFIFICLTFFWMFFCLRHFRSFSSFDFQSWANMNCGSKIFTQQTSTHLSVQQSLLVRKHKHLCVLLVFQAGPEKESFILQRRFKYYLGYTTKLKLEVMLGKQRMSLQLLKIAIICFIDLIKRNKDKKEKRICRWTKST